MDTLHDNEVDIGEVQVGLCDNMIETNSTIWESYESYHSKDDTFTWESVEMNNELFGILQQRDAPTKDYKGKGKVDYSSSSRKLKTKGSGWSEESYTSEELDVGQIFFFQERFVNEIKQAKSWVVGELIKSKFKGAGRLYKPRDIIEDMRQDYGINMSYEKAQRGRENAYERVRGSPEESYNLLRKYGEALKFTNPGFFNCIRPVIVMDGTFLKNKYRGQLIVAVCLDGNNQIYPLAFGVVDRETDDSIQWFLEKLEGAIGEVPNLGFVTDQKTCFSKEAWRHLLAFPNGSRKYLNDVGIARWSRVHCPGRQYNMMTTNIAESMNSILKEPRDLPIASFVEHVRALLQRRFWERREEGIKVTSTLTKWAELVIQKKQELALTMKVNPIDCYQFHVKDLDKEEVVNLQTKECTCKEFQAEQLPCSHAIAAARDRNINVYSLCANYYTNECLLAAYAEPSTQLGISQIGRQAKTTMAIPSNKFFSATISCQVHKIDSLMKDKLTKEQLQMFDKTIFGSLLNVNMVFNDQLIHHFLLRQIPEDGNADGICFSVLGKNFKDKSTRKKEAYELKKTISSKAVAYYNIKGYVLAFQVWAYEVLLIASEHLATRNSKGLIPRILRWNCTQAPSYKMLQKKNIFHNKNIVVKPKLKPSTQEKAFMESRIRGDNNMQMDDDESIQDINNNDTNTPDHAMNNKSLEQSESSPQLSPQREQSQTVADQSEMHPITNKKRCRSKKMDDTIKKQSLELSEMKQMIERLVQNQNENQGNDHTHQNENDGQNREDIITSDQAYVEEQHTEEQHTEEQHTEHQEETQRWQDADLLMTIRDILDNLNAKSQKEKDLLVVITTLPLVTQPLALCEMAPLDQTVQIHKVLPSISIVNEESQLETTKQQVEIHKNDEEVTLVEKEPVTVPDKDEEQNPIKRRKLCKIANKKVPHEDEQVNPPTTSTKIISESTILVLDVEIRDVDRYNPMWKMDSKLWKTYLEWKRSRKTTHEERIVVSTTRKKDFFKQLEENTWVLGDVIDMRKCKIYVFDSMPNYVEQKLVDQALQMRARCIASLAIAIGVNLHSERFTYSPWPVRRSKATLRKGVHWIVTFSVLNLLNAL
ncbi:MuDRA-like transposase [Cucumis melo var. makuwa]|uniref:MuDRA-like transposase n=1 Tax=Cucumis melo var. makuwa TaxID=1194695 RepID=A0A5D3BIZ2_CUCMM|nr:MuDRA-like transposase [Cucumis melo var. makuwa]TYJ98671.1 MuDRA-like transposase [Cucumis melo var. makuwa]